MARRLRDRAQPAGPTAWLGVALDARDGPRLGPARTAPRPRGRVRPGGRAPLPTPGALRSLARRSGRAVVRDRSADRRPRRQDRPIRARRVTGDRTPTTFIEVDGRTIRVTNPDRVLWPRTGTTKRELIGYYLDVAPVLLPHVVGRGLTLGRWPEDVEHTGWLQAECRGRPEWLPVHEVTTRAGGRFGYCMVEDRAGLAWLANLGTIELHPFLARTDRPDEPSFLVFDLDPGAPAGLADAARVALDIRRRLDAAGVASWPKASGVAGLHLYAPLRDGHTFGETKAFARALAAELAAIDPDRVTDRA